MQLSYYYYFIQMFYKRKQCLKFRCERAAEVHSAVKKLDQQESENALVYYFKFLINVHHVIPDLV